LHGFLLLSRPPGAAGPRHVSPNGVLDDPTGASAAEGELLLAQLAAALAETLAETLTSLLTTRENGTS
jgi:creatinine amidohydrolase/Fe(II)-dependent formamide hydrolase-like protein